MYIKIFLFCMLMTFANSEIASSKSNYNVNKIVHDDQNNFTLNGTYDVFDLTDEDYEEIEHLFENWFDVSNATKDVLTFIENIDVSEDFVYNLHQKFETFLNRHNYSENFESIFLYGIMFVMEEFIKGVDTSC